MSRVVNNETAQGEDHKVMKKCCRKNYKFSSGLINKTWQKHVPENNEKLNIVTKIY
jgi:hypothetical protein